MDIRHPTHKHRAVVEYASVLAPMPRTRHQPPHASSELLPPVEQAPMLASSTALMLDVLRNVTHSPPSCADHHQNPAAAQS
jgi:hypothetical protein